MGGYLISLNFNVVILIASFLQNFNLNFNIQMLAGNKLKICVGAGIDISSTIVKASSFQEKYKMGPNEIKFMIWRLTISAQFSG